MNQKKAFTVFFHQGKKKKTTFYHSWVNSSWILAGFLEMLVSKKNSREKELFVQGRISSRTFTLILAGWRLQWIWRELFYTMHFHFDFILFPSFPPPSIFVISSVFITYNNLRHKSILRLFVCVEGLAKKCWCTKKTSKLLLCRFSAREPKSKLYRDYNGAALTNGAFLCRAVDIFSQRLKVGDVFLQRKATRKVKESEASWRHRSTELQLDACFANAQAWNAEVWTENCAGEGVREYIRTYGLKL